MCKLRIYLSDFSCLEKIHRQSRGLSRFEANQSGIMMHKLTKSSKRQQFHVRIKVSYPRFILPHVDFSRNLCMNDEHEY